LEFSNLFDQSGFALRRVIALRIPEKRIAEIDSWAKAHKLSRSEANRQSIDDGLKANGKRP
jgi:hypothetical protein